MSIFSFFELVWLDIEFAVKEAGRVVGEVVTLPSQCADFVLNDAINDLKIINDENEKIITRVNSRKESAEKNYLSCIERLNKQKKEIHEFIICPFLNLMDKMNVNSQYTGIEDINSIMVTSDKMELECFLPNYELSDVTLISYIVPGIDVINKLASSIKVSEDIDRAKEERERLKAERNRVYAKCRSIEKITEFMLVSYQVVNDLEEQAKKKLDEIMLLVKNKGYNYVNLSDSDLALFASCTNTIVSLNKIINCNLLRDKGIINPVLKSYIEKYIRED